MPAARAAAAEALKMAAFVYGVHEFVVAPTTLVGRSMEPTFRPRDEIVLTNKAWARLPGLERRVAVGDVVIAHAMNRGGTHVCKRVAAKAGEDVRDRRGRLVRVPPGHVWLLGDNPGNSTDSRSYGPVPLGMLVGKVGVQVWPLWRFRWSF